MPHTTGYELYNGTPTPAPDKQKAKSNKHFPPFLFRNRSPPQQKRERGNLVKPWWNPGGPWWMESAWNLASGLPRTTPERIWAETPKLSAVGGQKQSNKRTQTNNTPCGGKHRTSSELCRDREAVHLHCRHRHRCLGGRLRHPSGNGSGGRVGRLELGAPRGFWGFLRQNLMS